MSDPIAPTGSPGQSPLGAVASLTLVSIRPIGLEREHSPYMPNGSLVPEADAREGKGHKIMNVEEAAKAFREYLNNLPSDLEFVPDSDSGVVVFKVVNPITHKVLRQYPPEEMLKMARNLQNSGSKDASGILLDHKL